MDIANKVTNTVGLLKSQISGQAHSEIAPNFNGYTHKEINENETIGNDGSVPETSQNQQSTGEEFSTFLTLLTAQIENQDPLAPLDSTQFVEQLATFSNLELQAKGNKSLDLIATLLARQIELLTPTDPDIETSA